VIRTTASSSASGNFVQRIIGYCGAAAAALLLIAAPARADDATPVDASPEDWSLHFQATNVWQYHPAFHSAFQGANSMDPGSRGNETIDATLFAGVRLWDGGELYVNPEMDQGFGLSDTLGVAGFTSGEAYKVGKTWPYYRLQRLFGRFTIDLGGDEQAIAPAANQLGGAHTADTLVITAGKFSVTDVFDTNIYAHDPKADFMNWAIIDSGAFDYAADAWGYSYGVTAEWTQDWWTLRAGLFDLSRVPNTTELVRGFGQYEIDLEGEARYPLMGQQGTIKLLAFVNRGRMGSYNDAVAVGEAHDEIPDPADVRRPAFRPGFVLNVQQALSDNLGAFARLSINDGSEEAYEFTEINNSVAAGLSLKGANWSRPDDTVGLACVTSGLSKSAENYFAAGGLGILIGDGALPHPGRETILETYYSAAITGWLSLGGDYQWIDNPAYNTDRGPISVLSGRIHIAY
jgi:high affinity Mn2+ porin